MRTEYHQIVNWDLWVDYHRTDTKGLTHTAVRNAAEGVALVPGTFVVVGNEEADPAVAEVISVSDDGVVLVRVLPGPAQDHRHLITAQRAG